MQMISVQRSTKRPLVVAPARVGGMPNDILLAYDSLQANLVVRNQIGQHLGEPHVHRCSIPQGCPFSMTLIALLMRPWIMLMRDNQVEPRVLADDLFLHATRTEHASKAVKGMALSRQYFHDIGAKVADNKCFLTSSCATTRTRLRTLRWDQQGNQSGELAPPEPVWQGMTQARTCTEP